MIYMKQIAKCQLQAGKLTRDEFEDVISKCDRLSGLAFWCSCVEAVEGAMRMCEGKGVVRVLFQCHRGWKDNEFICNET
jgi:hypothetical protein